MVQDQEQEEPMTTILREGAEIACSSARASGNDLWLAVADLPRATGWTLKPEGFCQGDVCVPIPPARTAEFVAEGAVNVSRLWAHLGRATACDDAREVWVLGTSASERRAALRSLEAPDFTLPDLGGAMHTLHAHRGKKVFLVTWASW
jgi:hypothetical protein